MKNILSKTWIALGLIVLGAYIHSAHISRVLNIAIEEFAPVVIKEAESFLPIDIENGQITSPENALIEKTYGTSEESFNIVLDTRTDELNDIAGRTEGIYLTKKFIYLKDTDEVKIHDFNQIKKKVTVNKELLKSGVMIVQNFLHNYATSICFILFFIGYYIATMLYALFMHLAVLKWQKIPFKRNLCVTRAMYFLLTLIGIYSKIDIGVLASFAVFIFANLLINQYLFKQPQVQVSQANSVEQ